MIVVFKGLTLCTVHPLLSKIMEAFLKDQLKFSNLISWKWQIVFWKVHLFTETKHTEQYKPSQHAVMLVLTLEQSYYLQFIEPLSEIIT